MLPAVSPVSKSPTIRTFTGYQFPLLNPKPEDFCILDIAHHLGMLCRYNGAVRKFLSVAEHSVQVSYLVPIEHARWGLLHDAHEAYYGDMVSPLKDLMPEFRALTQYAQTQICIRYGLDLTEPEAVHEVDLAIRGAEKLQTQGKYYSYSGETLVSIPDARIHCWGPEVATEMFLRRWEELGGRRSD